MSPADNFEPSAELVFARCVAAGVPQAVVEAVRAELPKYRDERAIICEVRKRLAVKKVDIAK